VATLTPIQAFTLAGVFAVGYQTFLWQLAVGLQVVEDAAFRSLLKSKPKAIRRDIWPASADSKLAIVDDAWEITPLDLEVGDFVATTHEADLTSPLFQKVADTADHSIWIAETPGRGHLSRDKRKISVRVSRKGYIGAWRHRFVPEVDD
jgi:hypothetical protein